MLASVMNHNVRGVFLAIAVILFLVAAAAGDRFPRVSLVALGLAFAFFPAMWDAFAV